MPNLSGKRSEGCRFESIDAQALKSNDSWSMTGVSSLRKCWNRQMCPSIAAPLFLWCSQCGLPPSTHSLAPAQSCCLAVPNGKRHRLKRFVDCKVCIEDRSILIDPSLDEQGLFRVLFAFWLGSWFECGDRRHCHWIVQCQVDYFIGGSWFVFGLRFHVQWIVISLWLICSSIWLEPSRLTSILYCLNYLYFIRWILSQYFNDFIAR